MSICQSGDELWSGLSFSEADDRKEKVQSSLSLLFRISGGRDNLSEVVQIQIQAAEHINPQSHGFVYELLQT